MKGSGMKTVVHHSATVRRAEIRTTNPAAINPGRLAALENMGGGITPPSTAEAAEMQSQGAPPDFVPLHLETRAAVDTANAAHHLSRRQQTLRGWSCNQDGPITPRRINGRLAWPVADLKKLLGVSA